MKFNQTQNLLLFTPSTSLLSCRPFSLDKKEKDPGMSWQLLAMGVTYPWDTLSQHIPALWPREIELAPESGHLEHFFPPLPPSPWVQWLQQLP